jgi:TipAS antibiotic-recognition protein
LPTDAPVGAPARLPCSVAAIGPRKPYAPEQLEQLEQRRQSLGPEAIERVQGEWAELFAQLERHRSAGTDPAAPEVQTLSRRSEQLIEMFTGGDPGIRASLKRRYDEEGPERASRGMASPELFESLRRAHDPAAPQGG